MIHRILSAMLVCALLAITSVHPAQARTKEERRVEKRVELAQKVRHAVEHMGTGPDARVVISRRDAAKLEGYVSQTSATGFVVTDQKTGTSTPVAYDDVTKVKGHNLATGWKIAIGAGALFALALILVWTGAIGDGER